MQLKNIKDKPDEYLCQQQSNKWSQGQVLKLIINYSETGILRAELRNNGVLKTQVFKLRTPCHPDHVPDISVIFQ